MLCAQRGRAEALKALIEAGVRSGRELKLNERDKDGRTALFYACEAKSVAAVKTLLRHGADPKFAREEDGMTCLHVAAAGNQVETVKDLLAGGADVHQKKMVGKDRKGGGTARSVANQLDNDCVPILMEASKRTKPMERSEDTMPDWAKGQGLDEMGAVKEARCLACNAAKPTKTCGRCKKVKYCSLQCQRLHWKEHKKLCVPAT